MKHVYLVLFFILPMLSSGQYVFNAAFQSVKFGGPGVTITNKVSNGTTSGSVVLYQNVATIGGQQIDAIIRTVSVSGGASMLFDQAGTGTGYTNNNPTWFSPQFLFPVGGGSALFEFEFILGNSFNNATNTGTPVTLQNMMINSYDIDGNDSLGSNQFSEFGGFFTSEVSTTTSLNTTYNSTTDLTRFASKIYTNVVNAADPNTRVRVSYQEMNNFRISVGSGAAGVAYFFIDFDKGADFSTPTKITTAPTMDLNPGAPGTGNAVSLCSQDDAPFSASGKKIASLLSTSSGGTTLERLRVSFNPSDIKDGASEIIQAGSRNIPLNFANGATILPFSISGTTYSVAALVSGSEKSLIFTKSGSATMTLAEGEKLLDALSYSNQTWPPTPGDRTLKVRAKDGAYESQAYNLTVSLGYTPKITKQPQASSIAAGAGTSFTVISNALSYQWQVDPGTGTFSNISNSTIYSGATTSTLTLTDVPYSMNNYRYRTVTSVSNCASNSANASLAVLMTLPVKLMNITATRANNNIIIEWGTSAEINSKSFSVQQSADGIHFRKIGDVDASGSINSDNYYRFIDKQPLVGDNYYRIIQTDADGKVGYSKIVNAHSGGSEKTRVLSNPVSNGQLTIQVDQPSSLMLFSSDGRMLKKEQAAKGIHTMNVAGISRGIYTLIAGTEVKRILINQ